MIPIRRTLSHALLLASLAAAAAAHASSHREAPGITETPKVDATDFYMFNSYEPGREGYVTIIANYQPFQTPYGGPNFFSLDPDALYQIHIDNDGDAREDLTFSFRFQVQNRDIRLNVGGVDVSQPLYNVGGIGPRAADNANLNVLETYCVDVVYGDQYYGRNVSLRDSATGSRTFRKPADFVGRKSQLDYEAYARDHITTFNLPGNGGQGRVFVGQRKDPFVVNLGEVFDLVNFNPVGPVDAKPDALADANCTSIIIEVPASFLRSRAQTIVGGWTSASLPSTKIFRENPTFDAPTFDFGRWVQVSRLAMPLVNEVVIGLRDKNAFNASQPRNDAQFATYVTNPTLPVILQTLFNVQPPCLPRNDLVQAFLTGLPGLNQPPNVRPAEMMRLNTNIEPNRGGLAIRPRGTQSNLGALGGDLQGFPNGRRPGDDVVDIELRVVMGALYPDAGQPNGCAPAGALPLTDGAVVTDIMFGNQFPYLNTPLSASPAR